VVLDWGKRHHPGTARNVVSIFVLIIFAGLDHSSIIGRTPSYVFQWPKGSIGKTADPKLVLELGHVGHGFCLKGSVVFHGKFSFPSFGGDHDDPIGSIRTI